MTLDDNLRTLMRQEDIEGQEITFFTIYKFINHNFIKKEPEVKVSKPQVPEPVPTVKVPEPNVPKKRKAAATQKEQAKKAKSKKQASPKTSVVAEMESKRQNRAEINRLAVRSDTAIKFVSFFLRTHCCIGMCDNATFFEKLRDRTLSNIDVVKSGWSYCGDNSQKGQQTFESIFQDKTSGCN